MTLPQAQAIIGNHPPVVLKFKRPVEPRKRRAARILVRAVKRGIMWS